MDSLASYAIGVLVFIVAIQAAAIVRLLIRETQHRRADRTLRESEERFRRIVEGVPVMIWTARPDTTLDYFEQHLRGVHGAADREVAERRVAGRTSS